MDLQTVDNLIRSSEPARRFWRGPTLILMGLSLLLGALWADPKLLPAGNLLAYVLPQCLLIAILAVMFWDNRQKQRIGRLLEEAMEAVHLQDWPEATAEWTDAGIDTEVTQLLTVRAAVNEKLEGLRQAGTIGKSLDAAVKFTGTPGDAAFRRLEKHRDFLPELFIVSSVSLAPVTDASTGSGSTATPAINVHHARELGFVRCPRCWRWVPALQSTGHGEVCPRCADALGA